MHSQHTLSKAKSQRSSFGQVSSHCTHSPAGLHAVTPLALRVSLLQLSGAQGRSERWLTLLHRHHSGGWEGPGRNLCAQALYKTKRLQLHQQQHRWQEHISALRAASACLSSIARSHTLCSCHHRPCVCGCFVNPRPLSLQGWICLGKVSLRLGCPAVLSLSFSWSEEAAMGAALPPSPGASPHRDAEPRVCPSPAHQHHLPRPQARRQGGRNASL